MKKTIFIAILLVSFMTSFAYGQVNSKAIGVRASYGAELSYQHPFSHANRLEADLGFYYDHGFNLAGVYQWVFDLSELATGFNWYVGLGPQIGSWDYHYNGKDYDGLALGIAGQIGIEYNFDIPLQLSLDYRPGWYILPNSYGGAWEGVALGIRYKF
ncbi:MAG TPA: hypothetical protein P5071_02055 [Paludibacteraceae bacterium]|nr:hypothetical protein [Paludibacteraceae bacterium]HRR62604.1 hypothetical protein [Paludibacteraceae bacterium]